MFYDINYVFHARIQFLVTAKPDQDPDPHGPYRYWFGSLVPDLDPHRGKKKAETASALMPMRIHNTDKRIK